MTVSASIDTTPPHHRYYLRWVGARIQCDSHQPLAIALPHASTNVAVGCLIASRARFQLTRAGILSYPRSSFVLYGVVVQWRATGHPPRYQRRMKECDCEVVDGHPAGEKLTLTESELADAPEVQPFSSRVGRRQSPIRAGVELPFPEPCVQSLTLSVLLKGCGYVLRPQELLLWLGYHDSRLRIGE